MPTLDIFGGDAFTLSSLTASINEVPEGQAVPTVVDTLFEEQGITTTSVWVEKKGDTLKLVPAAQRGSSGEPNSIDRRDARSFNAVHLPTWDGVNADEVQGIRAFGSESEEEMVERLVQQKLDKMRRNLMATNTYQRIGAVKGQVLDADGSTVLTDLFTEFGVTQQTHSMELDQAGTTVRVEAVKAKRKSEKVIGTSAMITGWLALCGEGFMDLFLSHADTKDAYSRWQDGAFLRNDPRSGFPFAGINWMEFYGSVGGVSFIGTNDAYLIPLGVPDLFITRYAPADYMETVNTVGLPYYAKQEMRKMGKGIDMEAQSNPINLCTKPRSVIKLTHT